jgi:hypothetical protein
MAARPRGGSLEGHSETPPEEEPMSATPARPTIDLDPPAAARPGLALVLALLSVPGVLVTWDVVPGGGFTTGVPLGIAAIVVGLQARARLGGAPGSRMALSAIVVAGLAVLSVVFFTIAGSPDSDAQAQAPAPAAKTIVLKELDKGSTFKHVRNTKTAGRPRRQAARELCRDGGQPELPQGHRDVHGGLRAP